MNTNALASTSHADASTHRYHAMKLGLPALALLLAALSSGPAAADDFVQPSFSCTAATRVVEKMICTHATLGRADMALDALYKNASGPLASDDARTALRDEQREWLKQRDHDCIGSMTIEQATQTLEPITCLQDAYDARIRALRDVVSPPLIPTSVIAVDTTSLDAPKTPAKRRDFRDGEFSTEGQTLAFYVEYENNEAARQVWLYDISTDRLVAGTPTLGNPNPNSEAVVSSDVDLVWDVDTLYVRSEDEGEEGAGATSVYAATVRNGPSQLATIPERVELLFELDHWYRPTEDDLERLHDDDMLSDGVYALGRYMVWLSDEARGRIVLKMAQRGGVRMPVQGIAHGSWELLRTRFDAAHLIYPSRDGLMLFNLDTRKSRRIAGTVNGDLPVAYSAQPRMLAWASTRPCASATAGADTGLDADVPHPYLCVAALPAF